MRKGPDPLPIKDLIARVIEKIDQEKSLDEDSLLEIWKKAAGETGFRHSKPVSLHKGTLKIVVENPGWIQELTFKKRKILRELQRKFGKGKISDIRFRVGDLQD